MRSRHQFQATSLALGLLLSLGACSSPQTIATADSKGNEPLICSRETPTGTNFPKTICRTQAEVEAERDGAQKKTEQMQRVRSAAAEKGM